MGRQNTNFKTQTTYFKGAFLVITFIFPKELCVNYYQM